MDNTAKLISEIEHLKKNLDAVILVHNYQLPEIQDIADFIGDSLDLSRKAVELSDATIVFCGVRFMAETAKILSPNKTVLLPRLDAGCPMADMITYQQLENWKQQYPDRKVVAYVNTTAEIKTLTDVCCTSANAENVIRNFSYEKLLFIPDKNLGNFIKEKVPEKDIIVWDGYCNVHTKISAKNIKKAKTNHPDAVVLAHPECEKEVWDIADFVLSTNQMIEHVSKSPSTKFIVATETGILYRMQNENPQKKFYGPGSPAICPNMKMTRLNDVANALRHKKHEILLDNATIEKAKKPLQEMLKYT